MDGLDLKARRDETDKAALLDLLAETERELIEAQEKLEQASDTEADLLRHLTYCVGRLSRIERWVEGRTRYSSGLRAARLAVGWTADGIDSGEWDGEPL